LRRKRDTCRPPLRGSCARVEEIPQGAPSGENTVDTIDLSANKTFASEVALLFIAMAGKAEVDLFVRSYQTLLRSTGEVRVAGLLEPYLAMESTLHPRARDRHPDPAALTYVGLRLPPSMPDVRVVLLSTSIEAIQSRGIDLSQWRPQTAPARRRR